MHLDISDGEPMPHAAHEKAQEMRMGRLRKRMLAMDGSASKRILIRLF
jgi:hypothetical protein